MKDRLILGTNRSIVRALVDQVLDGKHPGRARPDDELEIVRPRRGRRARSTPPRIVRSQMMLKEGRTEDAAQTAARRDRGSVLSQDRRAATRALHVEGELATLDVKVDADGSCREARRSRDELRAGAVRSRGRRPPLPSRRFRAGAGDVDRAVRQGLDATVDELLAAEGAGADGDRGGDPRGQDDRAPARRSRAAPPRDLGRRRSARTSRSSSTTTSSARSPRSATPA